MRKTKNKNKSQGYVATRVVVGLLGLILSVVLHELFHIILHWDYIRHISFFPRLGTIVEINAWIPPGYDLEGEEIAAYGITLLVVLITIIIIFKIQDSEDNRSTGQILFPKDKEMQKLDTSKLLEMPEFATAKSTVRTTKRKTKTRRAR